MKLICVIDEDGKREYINTKQIVSFYSETLSHNESLTYICTVDQCVHIIKNPVRDILDYLTNQEESPIKHNPKILLVYGENNERNN